MLRADALAVLAARAAPVRARRSGRRRPSERSARLRLYGAGLRTDPALPVGGGAFVLDDARDRRLRRLVPDGSLRHASSSGSTTAGRSSRITSTCCRRCRCSRSWSRSSARTCSSRGGGATCYAPTLIPIAAVYFTAHYFAYLLIAGEDTLAVIVDPFGHSWNPFGWGEYELWKGIAPAALVWWIQIAPDRLGSRRRGLRGAPAGAAPFERGARARRPAAARRADGALHRRRALGARAAAQGCDRHRHVLLVLRRAVLRRRRVGGDASLHRVGATRVTAERPARRRSLAGRRPSA